MKNHIFKTIAMLLMGATLLTAFQCGDGWGVTEPEPMIYGQWVNTANSYEITVAGQENIPEGCITMEFTADSVMVGDSRVNCLPEWQRYTLFVEDGRQLLEIEGGCHGGLFQVMELNRYSLVLVPESPSTDWDFRYTMTH